MPLVSTFCRLSSLLLLSLVILGSSPAHGTESAPSSDESAAIISKQSSPSYVDNDELLLRLQDYANNVGKRAYSYVSEFKRLPVYNFGLGKRSPSQLYGFGLGKRASGGRTYSFGLGKRGDDYDDEFNLNEQNYEGEDNDDDTRDEDELVEKRNRLYSFGLGKRTKPYSFGLGKRAAGDQRTYAYDSYKRVPQMYSFGLGKRSNNERLYSFGLGKRLPKQSSRFGFGLGKRDAEEFDDEEKRAAGDHRFSFGLGKREISQKDTDEVTATSAIESKPEGHGRAKRSLQYGFGLGKRSRYEQDSDEKQQADNENDLSRYARRQYSFGLGKRIPMYDFGIGKRSED